jgi:hypothetical protein
MPLPPHRNNKKSRHQSNPHHHPFPMMARWTTAARRRQHRRHPNTSHSILCYCTPMIGVTVVWVWPGIPMCKHQDWTIWRNRGFTLPIIVSHPPFVCNLVRLYTLVNTPRNIKHSLLIGMLPCTVKDDGIKRYIHS